MNAKLRVPPRAAGLPVLGNLPQFLLDPLMSVRELERRYGSVYRSRVLVDNTVLLGPDANQWVLHNRDHQFSSRGGWRYFIDAVFPGAVMSMDDPEHRLQRRIMQQAFKQPVMVRYLETMQPLITERIALWTPSQQFPVYQRVKQLTLDLATRVFMGEALGGEAQAINRAFVDAVEAPMAVLREPIPPFTMWRGVRGREVLVNYFQSLIGRKRSEDTPDFFSQFCHATDEHGARFSDQEVIDHMIFLMMAAHDTSTSTLSTIFYALAQQPKWQQRLREESMALPEQLSYQQLDEMPYHDACIKEALRMYPPLTSMPRQLTQDAEFKGYFLPKDSIVGIFPLHTHYMDEYWTSPFYFDPERFMEGRLEHKQHPFQYVPFGGGAHMCIGQHFAMMQIKSILHAILREYRWSVPKGYETRMQMMPIIKPRDGLPVHFQRLG